MVRLRMEWIQISERVIDQLHGLKHIGIAQD